MLAEAICHELCEKYPTMGFRHKVFHVGNTWQITSTRGAAIVIIGSRVLMTSVNTGSCVTHYPANYVPDIDLAQPGSFEKVCNWIERCWLHETAP